MGLWTACGMVLKDAMAAIIFLVFVTVVPFSFITAGTLVVVAGAKAFRRLKGSGGGGLTEREIEAIPKGVHREEQKMDCDCAVCLVDFEEGEEIRRLDCGHCYHGECIGEWLKRRAVCPKCAGKVVVKATRRRIFGLCGYLSFS